MKRTLLGTGSPRPEPRRRGPSQMPEVDSRIEIANPADEWDRSVRGLIETMVAGPTREANETRNADVGRIVRADTDSPGVIEHVEHVRVDQKNVQLENTREGLTSDDIGQSLPARGDDEAARDFVLPKRGCEKLPALGNDEIAQSRRFATKLLVREGPFQTDAGVHNYGCGS